MAIKREISIKTKLKHPCIKSLIKPSKDYGLVFKKVVIKKLLNKFHKLELGIYWYNGGMLTVSKYINNTKLACNNVYVFKPKNRNFTIRFNVPYFEPFNDIKHIEIENRKQYPDVPFSIVDVIDLELWYICNFLNEFIEERPIKSYLKNV